MEKIVRILVFSADKKVDLEELSMRFPDLRFIEEKNIDEGRRAIAVYGPRVKIYKIRKELEAEEIIPREEDIETDFFRIDRYPKDNNIEADIRTDQHDVLIDLHEEDEE